MAAARMHLKPRHGHEERACQSECVDADAEALQHSTGCNLAMQQALNACGRIVA